MQMLIKNAKLRDREELVNILIDGGKIVDIGVGLTAEAETVIDAEGNLTTASYIDPHIHLDKVNVLVYNGQPMLCGILSKHHALGLDTAAFPL